MGVSRFEDLIAWQKARLLVRSVYDWTREEPIRRDFGFCSQIQRAAVSAMSNIAEGFERATPREMQRFLSISKGSIGEVRSLLYLAQDIGYIDQERFDRIMKQAAEASRLVGALRVTAEVRSRRLSTQHSAPSTQHL